MPPSRRVSSRYVDPALAGLVALVVYCLHGFEGSLDRDQATFVYGGTRFAHGIPPYEGIFNSVGPLGDMVAGVGTRIGWLFGLDTLTGARLVYLVLSAACVSGVSVLAREALRSRAAGLLAPAAFLTFASFLKLATEGPREKTVMVLCLEVALLLLLRRRWFGAGVLTALATLTWQPVILPAAVAAGVAILTSDGRRLRAVATYVVGGAVPTFLMAGYFLAEGALQVAYWGFVRVNIGYTQQPDIVQSWSLVTEDFGWSLVLVGLGWVGALAFGGIALHRARRPGTLEDADRAMLVISSGALVAGLWSCVAINGGADLFMVLPFAGIGVAAALLPLGPHVSPATARRGCAAGVAVAVACAGLEAVATRDHRLPEERRDVTGMVAALPSGSTVISVHAPEVMVLLHRRNPYPWQLSSDAISSFLDDHLRGGLAGYADRISRLHPAMIAVGKRATIDWLQPVLDQEYTRVGTGDHWKWYAASDLGRRTLHDLRRVNRAAWAED